MGIAVVLSCQAQARIESQEAQARAAAGTAAVASAPVANAGQTAPGGKAAGGKGAAIYAANCSGCHAANGAGGVGPPLAGNPDVTGAPAKVVHTLLYGLNEKITVAGKDYPGGMPAWKGQLSDAEIAGVASYIRSAWGNSAGPVKPADVAKVEK
jgi:mono/diheme cytochrome c family protein